MGLAWRWIALAALVASLAWIGFTSSREPREGGQRAWGRGPAREGVATSNAPSAFVVATSAREGVPLEERVAVTPEKAAESSVVGVNAVDPPTPEQPGPGQALLQIEVVSLETGAPLPGVELGMSPTHDEDEHEWISSTQSDPARGVENDEVHADADGRAEFVLQTDFSYTLWGRGANGLAEEAELALEPFHEGEVRSVRLRLPTAWSFDWHGRVVDETNGRPIVGVDVVAFARYSAKRVADLRELMRGRTDGDGRVVLRLPAWESCLALVRAPGYFLGGCDVHADDETPEATQELTLRAPASLDVQVSESDGRPAADVEVVLTTGSWAIGKGVDSLDYFEWVQKTDGLGRCAFPELAPSADLLVALRRGAGMTQRSSAESQFSVELAPGEHARRCWKLAGATTVEARVRGREGAALAGLKIRLASRRYWSDASEAQTREFVLPTENGSSLSDMAQSTLTDEQGLARFTAVPAGWWAIAADDEAFPGVVQMLRVPADLTPVHIELVLERGASILGVLLSPDGTPVRGGVTWRGSEPRLQFLGGGPEWVGRDGTFELSPLVAGEYRLDASPYELLHLDAEPVIARTGDGPVEIHLRWAGVVRGTVVDADGQPVEAEVEARTARGWESASDGNRFSIGHLASGLYDFVATADDGRIGVLRGVRVEAGRTLEGLVIPVAQSASLAIRTHDESGALHRVVVEWEGTELPSSGLPGGEAGAVTPPGDVVVRWSSRSADGSWLFEHEERRTVVAEQELVLDWTVP